MSKVHQKRTVDAKKRMIGKNCLQRGHRLMNDNSLVFKMQFQIILHPFDIQNVFQPNPSEWVPLTNKSVGVCLSFAILQHTTRSIEFPSFRCGLKKTMKRHRLEQIIDDVQPIAFQRILRVSRCQDRHWRMFECLQKFEPRKMRHVDIEKEQIDFLFFKHCYRFDSWRTSTGNL